jgi:hypothetical protein
LLSGHRLQTFEVGLSIGIRGHDLLQRDALTRVLLLELSCADRDGEMRLDAADKRDGTSRIRRRVVRDLGPETNGGDPVLRHRPFDRADGCGGNT